MASHQTHNGLYINKDSQQVIIGSNNNITSTLNFNVPSGQRSYTISDLGKNANFLMNDSLNDQTIGGVLNINGTLTVGSVTSNLIGNNNLLGTISNGNFNSSLSGLNIIDGTITSGYIKNINFIGNNSITGTLSNGTLTNIVIDGGSILSNVSNSVTSSGILTNIDTSNINFSSSFFSGVNYNVGTLQNGSLTNFKLNNCTVSSNVTILGNISSTGNFSNINISSSTLTNDYNIGSLYSQTLTNATMTSGYISNNVQIPSLVTPYTEISNIELNINNTSYYYVLPDGYSISSQSQNSPRIYTSIQTAINAANTNGGGIVKLLTGTYTISSDLTLYSDVSIEGVANSGSSTLGITVTSDVSGTMRTITLTNKTGETGIVYNIAVIGVRFLSVGISLISSSNLYGLKVQNCYFYQTGSGQFINLNNSQYSLEDIDVSANRFETSVSSTMIYFTGKINTIGNKKFSFSKNILVTPTINDNSAVQLTLTENGSSDSWNKNITIDSNICSTSRFLTMLYTKSSTGSPMHLNTVISKNSVLADDFGNGILTAEPSSTSNYHNIYYRDNFVNGTTFFNANLTNLNYSSSQYGNYYFFSNILGSYNISTTSPIYLASTSSISVQNLGSGNYILDNPGWNVISSNNVQHSFSYQQLYEAGQLKLIESNMNASSIVTNSRIDIIPSTSNQMLFYTPTNTTTISISNPVTSGMIYTVQDVGQNANFVMTEGTQIINGEKIFSNLVSSTITGSSLSNCQIDNTNNFGTLTNINLSNLTLTQNNILSSSLSGGYMNFNNLNATLTNNYHKNVTLYGNVISTGTITGQLTTGTLYNNTIYGSLTGGQIYNSTLSNVICSDTLSNGNFNSNYIVGDMNISNNIVLGNSLTLVNAITSSRYYSLTDVGDNSSFFMDTGNQSITSAKYFTSNLISNNKIAIDTTSPSAPLQITPTLQSRDITANSIYLYNPNDMDNEYAIICARIAGSSGSSLANSAFMSFDVNTVNGWSVGVDNKDSQKFKIANSNNSLTSNTCITINTSQKVGIGTTNPTSTLHVNGTFQATSETITTCVINGNPVGSQSGYSGNYGMYQLSTVNNTYAVGTNTLIWDDTNTYFSSGVTHSNGIFTFANAGVYVIGLQMLTNANYTKCLITFTLETSSDSGFSTISSTYSSGQTGSTYNALWGSTYTFQTNFLINITSSVKYMRIKIVNNGTVTIGYTATQASRIMISNFGSTSYASFGGSSTSLDASASNATFLFNTSTPDFSSGDITYDSTNNCYTFTNSGVYIMILQFQTGVQSLSQTYTFNLIGNYTNTNFTTVGYISKSSAVQFLASDEIRLTFYIDTTQLKYWRLVYSNSGTSALPITANVSNTRLMLCRIDSGIYNISTPNYGAAATTLSSLFVETRDSNNILTSGKTGNIYFDKNGIYYMSLSITISGASVISRHDFTLSSSPDAVTYTSVYTSSGALMSQPLNIDTIYFMFQVTDTTRNWKLSYSSSGTTPTITYGIQNSRVFIMGVTTPTASSTGGLYRMYNSGEVVNVICVDNLIKHFTVFEPNNSITTIGGTLTNTLTSSYTSGTLLFRYVFNVKEDVGKSNILIDLDGNYSYISSTQTETYQLTLEYSGSRGTEFKSKLQAYTYLASGASRSSSLLPFSTMFQNLSGTSSSHTLSAYYGGTVATNQSDALQFTNDYFLRTWCLIITEVKA